MLLDPATQTLETPIAAYGITKVSRPMAAALLGLSLKSLNRRIADGQITVAGKVKKTVPLGEIEAVSEQQVSVHEFLIAMAARKPPPEDMHDGRLP